MEHIFVFINKIQLKTTTKQGTYMRTGKWKHKTDNLITN
jgi:hypothetical protein